MPKLKNLIPSYRRHKASGQAIVTLSGKDVYLGKYNSAASRAAYNKTIAEWTAHGGTLPADQSDDLTITELAAAFMRHAALYYRGPDGRQTTEVANYRPVVRRLKALYGRTSAANFGPLALKAVRQAMIDDGLARNTINKGVNRIRRMFKWAVENQIVAPSVLHGLQAIAGLRHGRSKAKETPRTMPVPDAFVDAVLPFVSSQVGAMIQLLRLTAMRSGEVTIMRGTDIDTRDKVWVFTPATHKTAWRGHERKIYLGPQAQAIVKPFLKRDLSAFIFSPADAEADRNRRRFGVVSADRRTRVYPCELRIRERRRAARKGRKMRQRYTTDTFLQAVVYGISNANKARLADAKARGIDADKVELIPRWHPHQLRHGAATMLRREHGIETARVILGHRSSSQTETYAEIDHARAVDLMARIG